MKYFSGLILLLALNASAQVATTDVAYRCTDTIGEYTVGLSFSAVVEDVEHCGRGISGGPAWFRECFTQRVQSGTATITDIDGDVTSYSYAGISPNPNLFDHIGYVFHGPRIYHNPGDSLVVYVRLGAPERSFFTIANERGLQERRRISCEITH